MRMKKKGQGGQIAIITVIFFLAISVTVVLGMAAPVYRDVKSVREFAGSRESFYLSEALTEDLVYRLKTGKLVSSSHSLTLNDHTATGAIATVGNSKIITTTGNRRGSIRRLETKLIDNSTGVSFNYGVQAGVGGIELENSSNVRGNVFANGPVTGAGNKIYGDVISAGSAGVIDNIIATSSAHAHTISGSAKICGNAYYQTIDSSSLSFLNNPTSSTCGSPTTPGTAYSGSSDQPFQPFPISDAQIAEWEAAATAGGILTCTGGVYKITADANLGPHKIPCDLEISNDPMVTLYGHVWVVGNVDVKNTARIAIDSSLGNKSLAIIADNLAASTTSSTIQLQNSTVFNGSGTAGSHILFISQNGSTENGGSNVAIDVKNSVVGEVLVYAPHGEIQIQNSVNLREVTAYKIHLKNSAEVIYQTGVANMLFSSGPSGGYDILSWQEIE